MDLELSRAHRRAIVEGMQPRAALESLDVALARVGDRVWLPGVREKVRDVDSWVRAFFFRWHRPWHDAWPGPGDLRHWTIVAFGTGLPTAGQEIALGSPLYAQDARLVTGEHAGSPTGFAMNVSPSQGAEGTVEVILGAPRRQFRYGRTIPDPE